MIQTFQSTTSLFTFNAPTEISRILTAAVVNKQFREKLLADPQDAISNGYGGETFSLEKEERNHLKNIHASSLAEFAAKLAC